MTLAEEIRALIHDLLWSAISHRRRLLESDVVMIEDRVVVACRTPAHTEPVPLDAAGKSGRAASEQVLRAISDSGRFKAAPESGVHSL
jgi:hypothetical protein